MPRWHLLRSTSDKPDSFGSNGDKHPQPAGASAGEHELQNDPIVSELRKYYDDLAADPLPEPLLDLLQQLDRAERKR